MMEKLRISRMKRWHAAARRSCGRAHYIEARPACRLSRRGRRIRSNSGASSRWRHTTEPSSSSTGTFRPWRRCSCGSASTSTTSTRRQRPAPPGRPARQPSGRTVHSPARCTTVRRTGGFSGAQCPVQPDRRPRRRTASSLAMNSARSPAALRRRRRTCGRRPPWRRRRRCPPAPTRRPPRVALRCGRRLRLDEHRHGGHPVAEHQVGHRLGGARQDLRRVEPSCEIRAADQRAPDAAGSAAGACAAVPVIAQPLEAVGDEPGLNSASAM